MELATPEPLSSLLERMAGEDIAGLIAIRNGKVLQPVSLVKDGDRIELFPALAGG